MKIKNIIYPYILFVNNNIKNIPSLLLKSFHTKYIPASPLYNDKVIKKLIKYLFSHNSYNISNISIHHKINETIIYIMIGSSSINKSFEELHYKNKYWPKVSGLSSKYSQNLKSLNDKIKISTLNKEKKNYFFNDKAKIALWTEKLKKIIGLSENYNSVYYINNKNYSSFLINKNNKNNKVNHHYEHFTKRKLPSYVNLSLLYEKLLSKLYNKKVLINFIYTNKPIINSNNISDSIKTILDKNYMSSKIYTNLSDSNSYKEYTYAKEKNINLLSNDNITYNNRLNSSFTKNVKSFNKISEHVINSVYPTYKNTKDISFFCNIYDNFTPVNSCYNINSYYNKKINHINYMLSHNNLMYFYNIEKYIYYYCNILYMNISYNDIKYLYSSYSNYKSNRSFYKNYELPQYNIWPNNNNNNINKTALSQYNNYNNSFLSNINTTSILSNISLCHQNIINKFIHYKHVTGISLVIKGRSISKSMKGGNRSQTFSIMKGTYKQNILLSSITNNNNLIYHITKWPFSNKENISGFANKSSNNLKYVKKDKIIKLSTSNNGIIGINIIISVSA